MTLSQMECRRVRHAAEDVADLSPAMGPSITRQTGPMAQSFSSTTASNVPTDVFSPAVTGLDATSVSVATSCSADAGNSSPDLFPTQDVMEIDADENFRTSFSNLCEQTKADRLFDELCRETAFKGSDSALPHKSSFRHHYELQRVADSLNTTPRELLNELRWKGISSANDYDTFWDACQNIAKRCGRHLPEKSSPSAWNRASDSFFESETRERSVYLAGALTFKSKAGEGLFDFRLKPLQWQRSCRFHRQYGPWRFMVVTLPSLSADVPSTFKEKAKSGVFIEGVARWLAATHQFLGRKWRVFFLEADKKRSKTTTQAAGYKVHLFALHGEDISVKDAVEMGQFLNWHIPIEHNLNSTNLKLFQRLSLGLSKTISTFPLEASEFIRLPDPANRAVMNDGCARMSMTLAKSIKRFLGLNDLPSVFQGRVAGAKGLWMVVEDDDFGKLGRRKYCIEIADSQLKINPHPKDNPAADEAQRTFEVVDYSMPGKPATLNIQLLTILHDRGVSRDSLGDLLAADMGGVYAELEQSMRSPLRLRLWVQSTRMHSRGEEDIRMIGAWPDELEEQAIMLIDSGFTPETSPMLRECLRSLLSQYLSRCVERLQIRIPCSTFLFCVADPYGVLEPDEVHLSFSDAWKDPVTGYKETVLDGRDVLVARLPALLPSDVQRKQAVWKRELHHFKDVIVFSTKGEIPLAHMLSGGDYDGDRPWICWDVGIVSQFQNAGLPVMPSKKDCGLVQHNRRVRDVFCGGTSGEQLSSQVDAFFTGCFAFNLNKSYLGPCTLEHEKVVYFEGYLSAPNALKLATLCGYLVDSAKQGDALTTTAWRKLRKEVSPRVRDDPSYKNASVEHLKRESNIIDYVKFWRADPERTRILTEFSKHWPQQSSRDSTLCQPWTSMLRLSKSKESTAAIQQSLNDLRSSVNLVAMDWIRQQPKGSKWAVGQFSRSVENACYRLRAIKPLEIDHAFSQLWKHEQDRRFGYWSLLRASCFYHDFPHGKTVWNLAGEELCCIKAQADEHGCRSVRKEIYRALKCDSKAAKKIQRRLDDEDFEEETFGWVDVDRSLGIERDE
jgi:RNA dependent RNA polymerase